MSTLNSRKTNYTLIFILSFLFCAAAIFFMLNELVQNQAYFTKSFAKEQELFVEQIANQSKVMLEEGTEQDVIDKIIKLAETSGSRYWFFTKENDLLFYKNDLETEQIEIKNVDKLIYSFKAVGGYNINSVIRMVDSKSNGSVLFSASKADKRELVTVFFFQVNNINYSMGMCTTENYILTSGKIVKHNTYSMLVIVSVCIVLFSSILIGTLTITKLKEKLLISEKAMRSKNIKIEELTGTSTKAGVLYDKRIKIYGKDVLYPLLQKANRPELFPFSMLFIQLEYTENITYDDLVVELVGDIDKILPGSAVIAKAQDNLLAIIFFKTEYGKVKDIQEKLLKSWSAILKKLNTSVKTDVFTQFIGKDAPIDIFEFWMNQTI